MSSVEEWRAVAGWPYEVSSLGRIRRVRVHRLHKGEPAPFKKLTLGGHGYYIATLKDGRRKKTALVHRMVCEAFHGPKPPGEMVVAHNDSNKLNNTPGNLRWATRRGNVADGLRLGTYRYGERSELSRLTESQVVEIFNSTERPRFVAARFGISARHVYQIRIGVRWRHITDRVTWDLET